MKQRLVQTGIALLALATNTSPLLANIKVTEPTGGQNVSADKSLNSTNGAAYVSLGSIVLTEVAATDFAPGSNLKLVLSTPYGWRFNPGVGTVTFTGSRDINAATIAVTSSNLTVTYSVAGTGKSDVMTIGGLQVQALDGSQIS